MDAIADVARFRAGSALIHPVILSGGAGTRLWPLSRATYPKQLLPLITERTMLQETVLRNLTDSGFAAPLLICNDEHRFLIDEQLRQIGVTPDGILLEPVARNTCPAVAVAALWHARHDPDALLLIQPSDHVIGSPADLHRAVARAIPAAHGGQLVTFGIRPDRADTGYGYIQTGAPVDGMDGVFSVDRFVEKPDPAKAQRFVDSGAFLWNSGIFLIQARHFLDELRRLDPGMLSACERAVGGGCDDMDFFRLDAVALSDAPSQSVDRAVMEHTQSAVVVPVAMAWNDVGSWQALRGCGVHDADGNVVQGDVMLDRVRNSYVRSDGRLVAAIGIEDAIIVSTDDAVLVARSDLASDVTGIVESLRQRNRPEPVRHPTTYRPWGYYRTVDAGDRFQVKRIVVKPGAKLSLQMHFHRAEHWVVVHGTALVQRGSERILLRENESIYIPIGSEHRIENPGKLPLHLIEVQSGPYLGEDDIVRIADNYGRV
jgi:mannose-1-phosphate guanylyltransferase/mannose-6-phosphate isomerase